VSDLAQFRTALATTQVGSVNDCRMVKYANEGLSLHVVMTLHLS